VDQIGTAVGAGSQEEEVGAVVVAAVAAAAGETGTGSNTDFLKFFICFLGLLADMPDIGCLSCS
jgi:hypothetical protein